MPSPSCVNVSSGLEEDITQRDEVKIFADEDADVDVEAEGTSSCDRSSDLKEVKEGLVQERDHEVSIYALVFYPPLISVLKLLFKSLRWGNIVRLLWPSAAVLRR